MKPKRRLLLKIVIGFLVILALVLAAGVVALRSRAFHQYVLVQMIERAEHATGAKVEIGDFAFHWTGLRLDFYRVTVRGAEAASEPPLLRIDHAGLNVKILSLLEWKFEISNLAIDHPVVDLRVDAEGRNNLPHPLPSNNRSKPIDLFNLAVRRFTLDRGEIDCNDRQIPLAAEVRHLRAHVDFNTITTEYDGDISYRDGDVRFAAFKPLRHDLAAHFSVSPTEARVSPLVITARRSRLSLLAALTNYSDPSITGSYTAVLQTDELAKLMKASVSPSGRLAASGTFQYHRPPGRSFIDSLTIDGHMTSPKLSISLASVSAEALALRGKYRLSRGSLKASNIEGRLFGGHFTADLTVLHLTHHPQSSLTVSVRSLSIAAAQASLRGTRLTRVAVQGLVDGTAQASWHGNLAGLRVQSDATLSVSAPPATPAPAAISLTGAIHLIYAQNVLALNNTVLRTQHAEVDLNGSVGSSSALAVLARSDDLHETDLLAADLRRRFATAPSASIQPLGLSGSATFQGTLQGAIQDPRLTGRLSVSNLGFRGATVSQVRAGVALSSSALTLSQGSIKTGQGGVQFNVSVALRNGSYSPSNPVTLQLSAQAVPVADLESIAKLRVPVTGILSAHVSMHGSQLNPVGSGTIQIVSANVWNQPVQRISAQFQGTGKAVESTIAAQIAAGSAKANLTYYPQNQGYDGQVELTDISLQKLEIVQQRHLEVSGTITASAHGRGTLKSPELEASLEIPQLKIGQEAVTGVAAKASVAHHVATVALAANLSTAPVQAHGTIDLTDDYQANLTFSTGVIPVGPLLANVLPEASADINGQTQLEGWLRGPIKDLRSVQAHLSVPVLRLGYQSVQIANSAPITADYRNGEVVVAPTELRGTGTDLHFKAAAPLEANAPLSAAATGTVDLHVLRLIYPQWDSSGQIQLSLQVSGSRAHPDGRGELRIVNAVVEPPDSPLGLEKVNGIVALTAGRATIESLTAQAGGGSVTARGFVGFRHGLEFNLGLTAHNVRVRYPEGVREVLDSDLKMTGSASSALIGGQVVIDRLSFTQSFDLINFANHFGAISIPSPNTGFTRRVKLNVALRSSQELALKSAQISLRGSADLRVRGTLAEPVILGRATLTGGQLFFNSHRYQIQSGVIQFINPVTTEPIVNLHVSTTVNQYNLSVNFVGPFDRLRTTYTSDPPLPPLDILNLLLTGQPAEAPGTGLGAQALLAQGIASQLSSRVQKLVGVSSLTIEPMMGGYGTNAGARVAVQQQVTRKLFFTFSVDVTTTQDDIVQLNYELSRRLSLQAVRDQTGGYSLELKVHKTF